MANSLLTKARSPYPGLRPFRPDEADLFFGRDEQVDELLVRLGRSRFLAVVGESGCGKSSLILAGMIPALETGFLDSAGADWTVARMRPGSQPMRNLASAILDSSALASEPDRPREDLALIEAELRRGPLGLLDVLREGGGLGDAKLLLVVDQFEEIFRFRRSESDSRSGGSSEVDRNEAASFVSLLLRTIREPDGQVYVVLTMRSDFLGDCALFTGLPEALNDCQFLTPRLSFDQRKSAIEGPARVEGGLVEPDLTTTLLNDMGSGPDQLPLMQHALMRAWSVALARSPETPPRVEVGDYVQVGRLKDALSLHADSAYDGLRPDQRPIAERLFRALTGGNTGKRDTRRPTKLGEVASIAGVEPEVVAEVVDHFRGGDRNFLTPAEGPLTADTILDLSHESLIRQWGRLMSWAKDEAASAEKYILLERTASEKKQPWVGPDLEDILKWRSLERPNAVWAGRYGGSFETAMVFIEAGIARQAQMEDEKQSASRRELQVRLFKILAGLAILVVLLTAGLAAWAISERSKAKENESKAEKARLAADENKTLAEQETLKAKKKTEELARSEAKTREALNQAQLERVKAEKQTRQTNALILASTARDVSENFPIRSILLASEAINISLVENQPNVAAENELRRTLAKCYQTTWNQAGNAARYVAFSPDGKTLAAGVKGNGFGSSANNVVFFDANLALQPKGEPLAVPEGEVGSIAFSRDGQFIAAGFSNPHAQPGSGVIVWAAASRQRLSAQPLEVKGGPVNSVAFSPDGKSLAAAYGSATSMKGGVNLWELKVPVPRAITLPFKEAMFSTVAFGPNGTTIGAGFLGNGDPVNGVYLAKAATGQPYTGQPLEVKEGIAMALAFSPDSKTIAVAFADPSLGHSGGGVLLWDEAHTKWLSEPLPLKEGDITSISFSRDGKTLAAGYKGEGHRGGVVLWDLASRARKSNSAQLAAIGPVSSLDFSPVDDRIVVQDGDGLRLCDLGGQPSMAVEPRVLNEPSGRKSSFVASPDRNWIIEARADLTWAWKLPVVENRKAESIGLFFDELRFSPDPSANPPEVVFDPKGSRAAIVGPRDIAVWDFPDAIQPKPRMVIHAPGEERFQGSSLGPEGRWLVTHTGSNSEQALLFDLENKVGRAVLRVASGAPSKLDIDKVESPASAGIKRSLADSQAAFSPDGRWLAIGNRNGLIQLVDLQATPLPSLSRRLTKPKGMFSAITFHPDSTSLVAASIEPTAPNIFKIESWKTDGSTADFLPDPSHAKRTELSTKALATADLRLKFSKDGAFLSVVTDLGYELFQWTDSATEQRYRYSLTGARFSELGQTFSPDLQWTVTSGSSAAAVLLGLNLDAEVSRQISIPASSGPCVDFSDDSTLLASTSSNDSAILLDLAQWTCDREPGESLPYYRSFPGLQLAPYSVKFLKLGPDSKQLVTGGLDDLLRVWRLDLKDLLKTAERVAGRNLTNSEWAQYFPGIPYHATFPNLAPSASPGTDRGSPKSKE